MLKKPDRGKIPDRASAPDGEREIRVGQSMAQTAEPPHVDHVAHRVHDAAGGEEQEGLEERVSEQVKHGRHDRELGHLAHARSQAP